MQKNVQEWMTKKYPNVLLGGKICSKCKKISQNPTITKDVASVVPGTSREDLSDDEVASHLALDALNSSLQYLGESPVKKKRLQNEKKYPKHKLKKIACVGAYLCGSTGKRRECKWRKVKLSPSGKINFTIQTVCATKYKF